MRLHQAVTPLWPPLAARPATSAVFGLIALHQEVRDRSPEWRGAMDKWPVHTCDINGTCAVDPCGGWVGDWVGGHNGLTSGGAHKHRAVPHGGGCDVLVARGRVKGMAGCAATGATDTVRLNLPTCLSTRGLPCMDWGVLY